jgi:hypothetical protein
MFLIIAIVIAAVSVVVLGALMAVKGLLGQFLVLVNFGLSLAMASVAGAVLYYRVDWTDTPATADQPAGELVQRIARLKEARSAIAPNDLAWREARAALATQEARRQKDQEWYFNELEHLRTNPKKQPILALAYEKGRTKPDAANGGLPMMIAVADRFNKPLLPLIEYSKQQTAVTEDTAKILTQLEELEKKDTLLTEELNGVKDKRGLDQRIKDEKVKQTGPYVKDEPVKLGGVAAEMELVLLAEGQVRADSQLLQLRKKSLEARVKELEKPAVADAPK